MGGGSSSAKKLPDTLDEEATKSYAGDKWDKGKFDSFKGTDGLITKEQLLKAQQESEQENEQKPRRRSIDLTSPTGEDLTKDMSFSSGIKRNDTMAKHKTASLTKMGDLLGSSSGSLLQSTMEEGDEEEEEEEGEDAVPALAPAPVKRRGSGLGLVSETGEDLTKDLSFSSSIKRNDTLAQQKAKSFKQKPSGMSPSSLLHSKSSVLEEGDEEEEEEEEEEQQQQQQVAEGAGKEAAGEGGRAEAGDTNGGGAAPTTKRRNSVDLTSAAGEDLTKDMAFTNNLTRNDTKAKSMSFRKPKASAALPPTAIMEEEEEEEEDEES